MKLVLFQIYVDKSSNICRCQNIPVYLQMLVTTTNLLDTSQE